MPTPSDLFKLELQSVGENPDTWGNVLNDLIEQMEEAIAKVETITMAGSNITLSDTQYVRNQTRNAVIKVVGNNTGIQDIIIPDRDKLYIVHNNTTSTFPIRIVTILAQSAITIPHGATKFIYVSGGQIFEAFDTFEDVTSSRYNLVNPTATPGSVIVTNAGMSTTDNYDMTISGGVYANAQPGVSGTVTIPNVNIVSGTISNVGITNAPIISTNNYQFPTAPGIDTQLLTSNGSGQIVWIDRPECGFGMEQIKEDTTPQLGGDLDVNDQNIVSLENKNIVLVPGQGGKTVFVSAGNGNDARLSFVPITTPSDTLVPQPGIEWSGKNTDGTTSVQWAIYEDYTNPSPGVLPSGDLVFRDVQGQTDLMTLRPQEGGNFGVNIPILNISSGFRPFGTGVDIGSTATPFNIIYCRRIILLNPPTNLKSDKALVTESGLNSFEEGTFIPKITTDKKDLLSLKSQDGLYQHIGNYINFEINLEWNSWEPTNTGKVEIFDLPYKTSSQNAFVGTAQVTYSDFNHDVYSLITAKLINTDGVVSLKLFLQEEGQSTDLVAPLKDNSQIVISGKYKV